MSVLLKNPMVADGVSPTAYVSDILISGSVIVDVRPDIDADAEALDLSGLYVTPGFIDAHSHDDFFPTLGEHKIRQGITAEITGNCGLGCFPVKAGMTQYFRAAGLPCTDSSGEDYAAYSSFCGKTATRHAALVPHSNIRYISDGHMSRMLELLERCLEQGAIGMSAGLCSPPGSLANAAELEPLCAAVAQHGGIFAVHLRDEFEIDRSLDECIGLAEKTGVRLQISHIKAFCPVNFGRARVIINQIEAARSRGIEITADCYPYTASMTGFAALAPDFAEGIARRGGTDRIFMDGQFRQKKQAGDFFVSCKAEKSSHRFASLSELAKAENVTPEALAERFAHTGVAAIFECMDSADVDEFITTPWVMIGTDGVLSPPIHPRTYGAFAKYLDAYVNKKKLLTFAEAVRKITSLPADVFRLPDCGRLAKGYRADLVVLDLPRVTSSADYANPEVYPQGIKGVMIDGKWVYRE